MRFTIFSALIAIGLLAACSLGEPTGDNGKPASPTNPILGDAITVTSLDAEPGAPVTVHNPTAAPVPASRSVPEIACVKTGGSWVAAGKSGAKTCVRSTRDSGQQCNRQSQCEGLCLARSGSCAPVVPLFGCNEIFQNDGQRVTLCID